MARKGKLALLITALFALALLFAFRGVLFNVKPAYTGHQGKALSDPELYDSSGGPLKLSRLMRERGNPPKAILALWATWCDPCVRELPIIQKMIPEYKKAGVDVVLINYDGQVPEKSIPEVSAWLVTQKLNLKTNYDFDEALLKELDIAGLPFAVGLVEGHKVAWMRLGQIDWASPDKIISQFK